jgi:hypothetical protein
MTGPYLDDANAVDLYKIVSQLRIRSVSHRYFISFSALKSSLNKDLVVKALRQHGFAEQRIPRMAEVILSDGLRTFSILALLRQENLIEHFIDYEELDSKLPMEKDVVHRISPLVSRQFWEELQWELCPHFFRRQMHRKIRPNEILPFVSEERIGEGAGGEIFQCAIAMPQQSFYSRTEV